ncbi:MAG: CHAD domain-containing protein [Pseudomonadota bacterium]
MAVDLDREFEIKLNLRETDFAHLLNHAGQTDLALTPLGTETLPTTYFDTSDLELHRHGVTLRIRKSGGDNPKLTQTVKMQTGVSQGVSNPIEIEDIVENEAIDLDRISDEQVRNQMTELVANQGLNPMVNCNVDRTSVLLGVEQAAAELSLDRATVSAGGLNEVFLEAELELKSGQPSDLLPLAEAIFNGVPMRLASLNKAARGFALLEGLGSEDLPDPVRATQPELADDMNVTQAFTLICGSAISQILPNWSGLLDQDDPEFAHQLRVGIRRLRTALRMFRPYLDNAEIRAMSNELRDVARIVGDLRDADVLYEDIALSAIRGSGRQPDNEPLATMLKNRCTLMREAVRADIGSARWNGLLLRLMLMQHGWTGGEFAAAAGRTTAREFARKTISKFWKTVTKRGRNLENLDEAERHQLRKDLKKLRYAMEFLQSLHKQKAWRRFRKELKRLQIQFGYLNDVHMAKSLPAMIGNGHDLSSDTAMLAGFIDGWHEAGASDVLDDLDWHWQRLERRAGFWKK